MTEPGAPVDRTAVDTACREQVRAVLSGLRK